MFPPPPCIGIHYTRLFNGCPRGGAASTWTNKGNYPLSECQALCNLDIACNAIEVNGCLADPVNCGGSCYHFYGSGDDIHNGGCRTNGDQVAFRKLEATEVRLEHHRRRETRLFMVVNVVEFVLALYPICCLPIVANARANGVSNARADGISVTRANGIADRVTHEIADGGKAVCTTTNAIAYYRG